MWVYDSPAGRMLIIGNSSGYELRIGDDFCGRYLAPEAAADDVFTQHTDCNLWDRIEAPSDTPSCLREWQWMSDPQ